MSKISDDIRNKVADPSVSDHYGSWGALTPAQRRDIRKLCDACDMFEATADSQKAEIFALNSRLEGSVEVNNILKAEIEMLKGEGLIHIRLDDKTTDEMDDMIRSLNAKGCIVIPKYDESVEFIPSVSEIKAEAIKEFAERLKERKYQTSDWSHGEHPYVVEESDIDEVLEEMAMKGATNQ